VKLLIWYMIIGGMVAGLYLKEVQKICGDVPDKYYRSAAILAVIYPTVISIAIIYHPKTHMKPECKK